MGIDLINPIKDLFNKKPEREVALDVDLPDGFTHVAGELFKSQTNNINFDGDFFHAEISSNVPQNQISGIGEFLDALR